MSDYVIVSCKRGNKIGVPGKIELLHGMPIDYFDPDNYNPELSEFGRSAFLFFKMPKSMLPAIKDYITVPENETKWQKKKQFNFTEIGKVVDLRGITSTKNNKETIPILDISSMAVANIFKTIKKETVIDILVTTSGSKTIGTAGDFATIALYFTDFGNFTGDMLGTVISDVTETTTSIATENKNGNDLIITSTDPHYGNPNKGWLISKNFSGRTLNIQLTGAGTVEIKNLHIKELVGGLGNSLVGVLAGAGTVKIHDNLLDGNNKRVECVRTDTGTPIIEMYDCVLWNSDNNATFSFGLRITGAWNGSSKIGNITIFNCQRIAIDNANLAVTYTNVALINNVANFESNLNSVSNNCASDAAAIGAATDNDEIVNITVADEFVSTTDTNGDFLKLKSSSQLIGGGKAPTITDNNHGIRGNGRPNGHTFSIGADEGIGGIGGLIGNMPIARNFWPVEQ